MTWPKFIIQESKKGYFQNLNRYIDQEILNNRKVVYPARRRMRAFELTPFENVDVVILGKEPHHGEGQAHGLAYSVENGCPPPPSLLNILREVGIDNPFNGNLSSWASQGVLLLNTILTVTKDEPNSHAKKGWEFFTDGAIRLLNREKKDVIFLLMGDEMQNKKDLIGDHHHIILAPSPDDDKFIGCGVFKKVNKLLEEQGKEPIKWHLD